MMFYPTPDRDSDVLVRPRDGSIITAWKGFGKLRTRLTIQDWGFLVLSIINILTAIGLTSYRLHIIVSKDAIDTPDFTFSILVLVNAAFCLYYVLDGLFREREYELYVLVVAIIILLLYCIIEYCFHNDGRSTIKLVRLILICMLAPPNIVLAVLVARQFGYLECLIVGTSTRLQEMYREAARFMSAVKFDIQISVCLLVLGMHGWESILPRDVLVLCIGIPVVITWSLIGWVALVKESLILVAIFTMLGIVEPAYVIYKIWQMTYHLQADVDLGDDDAVVASLTLVACGLSLGVRIIVYFELSRVTRNFGYGLRPRMVTQESIHMGDNERATTGTDTESTTSHDQGRF